MNDESVSSQAIERAAEDQAVGAADSMEVADLLVAYLEQIGVEYVFGIPGGAVEPLYNALARSARRGGPRAVLARHESGSAFMADGYARETGKLGVCCATSGPGATNLITGIACAYENGIPMLAITGQPALPNFGKRAFQETSCTGINTVAMLRHSTRYDTLVSHLHQVENKVVTAVMRAYQAPRGPVHLSIPVDILRGRIGHGEPAYDLRALIQKTSLVDENAVRSLCAEINAAQRIVLIIGGGCGEAIESILELEALTGALFVTTPEGKGLVNPRQRRYRGVFGFGGHPSAIATLQDNPDLIIAIGTSLGEWTSGGWSESVLNERLVHIDSYEDNLLRTPMARLHVRGRIRSVCERLVELLRANPETSVKREEVDHMSPLAMLQAADKYVSDATPIKPQRLMRELSQRFPPNTRFFADAGNSMSWSIHYLLPQDRRANRQYDYKERSGGSGSGGDRRSNDAGWLRVIMDFAAMGWGIGAAVGAARGNPNCPVVCITGDGSYLMNGQEITVAEVEQLTVIFVVLNDGALGMVKHGQRLAGAEPTSFQLPKVDFRLMAESMGIPGHIIESPQDLDALDFDAILKRKGPTLLDVRVDGEEVPPMSVRMKVLAGELVDRRLQVPKGETPDRRVNQTPAEALEEDRRRAERRGEAEGQ